DRVLMDGHAPCSRLRSAFGAPRSETQRRSEPPSATPGAPGFVQAGTAIAKLHRPADALRARNSTLQFKLKFQLTSRVAHHQRPEARCELASAHSLFP